MFVVWRRRLGLLVGFVIVGLLTDAAGQTIPDDDAPPTAPAAAPHRDTRRLLSKQESLQRIKQAQELLRQGGLAEADAKLRGSDFAVRLDKDFDPRDVAFVQALTSYRDGKLRTAYNHAGAIHRAGKPGEVNTDAALLKSLIFVQAGVYPLAAHWANWILKSTPAHVGATGVLQVLAKQYARDYTLQQTAAALGFPDYQVDVWAGPEPSPQSLVLCLRKRDDFRGALSLERTATGAGASPTYVLRFYDLEGRPLLVTYLGETPISSSEMLARVKGLNPSAGKGRYSIMRGELEALAWQRAAVPPYAAKWAAYALPSSVLVAEKVQRPLQTAGTSSWELRGTETIFLPNSLEPIELRMFANRVRAGTAAGRDEHAPREDYHITVVAKPAKYLASFTVESSEPIPGERVFLLNFLINGARGMVKRYDELDPPRPEQIVEDVKRALETSTP